MQTVNDARGLEMNIFVRNVALAATLIALASLATTAQAQNAGVVVQIPGTSTAWFNTYADDSVRKQREATQGLSGSGADISQPIYPDDSYGQSAKDRPTLGVKRPYHRGYYGKIKPRRHVYSRTPRRNVRGYANAPWN